MSSSSHMDNKKKNILVLGKWPRQGLEHTLTADCGKKCIPIILLLRIKTFVSACITVKQIAAVMIRTSALGAFWIFYMGALSRGALNKCWALKDFSLALYKLKTTVIFIFIILWKIWTKDVTKWSFFFLCFFFSFAFC